MKQRKPVKKKKTEKQELIYLEQISSKEFNPIHPDYFSSNQSVSYSLAKEIVAALEVKLPLHKSARYAATSYLQNILHFLRSEFPEHCTIPHALLIASLKQELVFSTLSLNMETWGPSVVLQNIMKQQDSEELYYRGRNDFGFRNHSRPKWLVDFDLVGFLESHVFPLFKAIRKTSYSEGNSSYSGKDLDGLFDWLMGIVSNETQIEIDEDSVKHVAYDCHSLIDRAARTACLMGRSVEYRVFPNHFIEKERVVSTLGEPLYEGVTVN